MDYTQNNQPPAKTQKAETSRMKYIALIAAALTMTAMVGACNAVHGTGEDLERASGQGHN